jgi:hypothetical protein
MARESFKATTGDRGKLQVIDTDDMPDLVTVDLDDKDPNHVEVVEAGDQTGTDRGDPADWGSKNATDPKGVTPRVQKRFDRLKAETATENRLRLAAEAREAEAIRIAQAREAEVNDLRQRLANNTSTLAESMTGERKARITDAQRRLEQAHAEGNSAEVAKATADMTAAQAELATISANTPPKRTEPERQVQPQVQTRPQTQAPQLHPDVVAWVSRTPRFNQDQGFTRAAVAVHNLLEARGIGPGHADYIKELDKRMKAEYPDHQPNSGSLQDDGDDEDRSTVPRRTNAVTAGSRETRTQVNSRTVELTSTQLAVAKRLGVTPQAYAAELVKYNANRKDA